jgi:HD-GYP domain-containing protein (c-di-GMP phosphodiesterase class II)
VSDPLDPFFEPAPTSRWLGGAEMMKAAMAHAAATLRGEARFAAEPAPTSVTHPHPLLVLVAREELRVVVAPSAVWDNGRELLKPFTAGFAESRGLLILLGHPRGDKLEQAIHRGLACIVPAAPTKDELYVAVARAFELMESKARAEHRDQWVNRYEYELGELIDIARAMTTERDVNRLLSIVLEKSRFVTGADAGSVYVVEGEEKSRSLRFKLAQNDSVSFDSREFVMPLNSRSIAGAAALDRKTVNIADVYDLPAGSPFGFDRSFDERTGYLTKSVLAMPLISPQRDEVIGVLQLINHKKDKESKLFTREDTIRQVAAFDARSEELLGMVAAQAGASLENAMLYDEIRQLFEGFVRASVEAIESRDPTTSGHSRRVADYTVGLAKVVDACGGGPYKDALFSAEDLRELEYASLLHDFGKIGVREKVLVKAKKLYDEDLELIRARFDYVVKATEADVLARKVRALERGAPKEELAELDKELAQKRAETEAQFQCVCAANEPTVLAAGDFETIERLARESYTDLTGNVRPLLTEAEAISLSVKRGSLTNTEFDEIRSHVSHTFKFLSEIPWGKQFRRVPVIAGAHHERINGTGYPHRLRAEEIPVQSKMMSVADIYDALTASDRPYKRAVPVERALDILEFSVKDGHLDAELVRIFREARVWEGARR